MKYAISLVATAAYLFWLYRHLRPSERFNPYEMSAEWHKKIRKETRL